ncbi:MAG TPA: RDD family protein [Steroidobacteraceae bacterium]|nr:RDD family protein [Steroidobacteraceae bacterium]
MAAAGTETTVELARPWPRYWARSLDVTLWALLLALVGGALVPQLTDIGADLGERASDQILGIIVLPFAMAADALTYALFGNTPGKWLAGLAVRDAAGGRLARWRYLKRNAGVYVNGLALGVGLVALFTLSRQYRRVNSGELTSWDRWQESRVVRVHDGVWRTSLTAGLYLVLLAAGIGVSIYFGNLTPEDKLQLLASSASPGKPTMLDDTVRLDRVYVAPGLVLEFDYTVLGTSDADPAVFAERLDHSARADLVQQFCTDLTMVADMGGRARWRYADDTGRLLHAIEVSKKDCPARR